MDRVDAHLHVWQAAQGETPGVSTIVSPQTNVPIELAQDTLVENKIDRAVLVQPVFRGEDNSYVAVCARAQPRKYTAVCVVDPRLPGACERLEHWVAQGCLGLRLRPRIAAEEKIFGDPATWPLWEAAGRLQMVVSVLCGPEHARTIAALAERFDGVSIVVDHMGHPDVGAGPLSPSFAQLLALARHPNVSIKVSGFYHFSAQPFPYADCWEMIRAMYDQFGPGRLIWGSDFPHVVPSCGYKSAMLLPEVALEGWPADDRDLVMGSNALKLYWPDDAPAVSNRPID